MVSSSKTQSSSTHKLEITPPPPQPNNNGENITTNRDRSEREILEELNQLESEDIYYAAKPDITNKCEFIYNIDLKGNTLIKKNTQNANKEFTLAGIFQIDARNFFMTADGKWNPNNQANTRLDQVKPSCHLLPIQRDPDFPTSSIDFSTIITNLRAIETMINTRKTHEGSCIITADGEPPKIKIIHHLFIVRSLPPISHLSNTLSNHP
jgi:hypothetical protein